MKQLSRKMLCAFFCVCIGTSMNAQNVAVNDNGAAPNSNAILDVDISSNNKGILIPRLTTAQRTGIGGLGAGDEGLTVYDTTTDSYWLWDGTQWVQFAMSGTSWEITGNAGLTAGTNFMGTTDATDVSFKRNSVEKMRIGNAVTTFANEIRTRDGGVTSGDVLVHIWDSGDDGVIDIYENNAYNHRIHGNSTTIFNEQGLSLDFRIESDTKANMFFVDASTNEIGIGTATPSCQLQNYGTSPASSPLTESFDNGGTGFCIGSYTSAGTFAMNGFTTNNTNGAIANRGTYAGTGVGYAGYFHSNSASGYGVYGSYGGGSGWAIFGNSWSGGTTAWQNVSDKKLKKNIKGVEGGLNTVMQLNPVEYDMRIDEFPGINLPEGKQIGFIAQELEKVVPNVVHDKIISGFADNGEYNEMEEFYKYDVKTVDYTSLIPVLTKAIQEQ